MRELKFKVWDTIKQTMFKPQGITFDAKCLTPFAVKVPGRAWEPMSKYEILQWTGLVDIDGNDIYEADIIRISDKLFQVIWNEKSANFELIECGNSSKRDISDVASGNIVGNKLENPDLFI